MDYAFIFIMISFLLSLPSSASAQNPKGFLTFGNCTVGFFYPEEWKDFISDSPDSNCERSDTTIEFPQPSLSEKRPPFILINVEQCCEIVTSRDENNAIFQNMSLEEYVQRQSNELEMNNGTIINSGPIILGTEHPTKTILPGYKIIAGPDSSNPTSLTVYAKNGTKVSTIHYWADPSDYHTYLPGLQKIADSFFMFVS
jgi:hypothetical protein